MTTTITTIREPKTFQQIQDQQNEIGKQSALESLNDNISKLIKAINDKDAKRETEQDRQLKTNQLELSKLQLRRAQLGLAKDEKYYQDYSRKSNERNNFGTRLGFEHDTSTSLGATGLSLLTGGLINPVILKQVIFPLVTPLKNITKVLASFPGLIPMLFNRVGGKSSSAIKSDKDRILHGKLDQILGAIKDKTKSSKVKEEKEQSLLSKLLNALLLGAAGIFAVDQLFEGADGVVMQTLKDYGPAMIAGYALGGWKGALVGAGLVLGKKAWDDLMGETQKTPEQIENEKNALQKINSFIPVEFLKFEDLGHFKATVAGLMIGGLKGAAVGWVFGKYADTIKKWLGKLPSNNSNQDGDNTGEEKNLLTKLSNKFGFTFTETNVTWTAAGLMFGGIKGAAFGLAASIIKDNFFDGIINDKKVKDGSVPTSDETSLQDMLESKGISLSDDQIKAAAAGAMLFGWRGAVAGILLASDTAKKVIPLLLKGDFAGIADQISNSVGNLLEGTVLEGISDKVITGALAGAAMGLKGGVKGVIVGALLGGAGGFIWERIKSKELAEKHGFETTFDGLIGNSGKTWDYFEKQTRKQLESAKDENGKRIYSDEYIKENLEKETANLINSLIADGTIKNEEQSITDRVFNHIKEHPKLDAAIATYGAYKFAPIVKKTAQGGKALLKNPMTKSTVGKAGQLGAVYLLAEDTAETVTQLATLGLDKYDEQSLKEAREASAWDNTMNLVNIFQPTKMGYNFQALFEKGIDYTVKKWKEKDSSNKVRITNPQVQEEITKAIINTENKQIDTQTTEFKKALLGENNNTSVVDEIKKLIQLNTIPEGIGTIGEHISGATEVDVSAEGFKQK